MKGTSATASVAVGLEAKAGKLIFRLEAREARLPAGPDSAEERVERQIETLQRHLGRLGVHSEIGRERHCNGSWGNFTPASIALDAFLKIWLPGLQQDGHLVGVQFNAELAGLEVEPSKLATDLRA
jgi:uncharacterized protein DUF2750